MQQVVLEELKLEYAVWQHVMVDDESWLNAHGGLPVGRGSGGRWLSGRALALVGSRWRRVSRCPDKEVEQESMGVTCPSHWRPRGAGPRASEMQPLLKRPR